MTNEFNAPEGYEGGNATYTKNVLEIAEMFKAAGSIDGDARRGFLEGGIYSHVKVEDVQAAMKCEI